MGFNLLINKPPEALALQALGQYDHTEIPMLKLLENQGRCSR